MPGLSSLDRSFLVGPKPRDKLGCNISSGRGILSVSFVLDGAVYPVFKTLVGFSLTIMQGEVMRDDTH